MLTSLNTIYEFSTILEGSDSLGISGQGQSLAISADGTTLAIGGPLDNVDLGAVWMFQREKRCAPWVEAQKIACPADAVGFPFFGASVALSNDGSVLAVGAIDDGVITSPDQIFGQGAVWVFRRYGETNQAQWFEQQKIGLPYDAIIPTAPFATVLFGDSVSLDGCGKTLAIGGPGDNTSAGAAWIYTIGAYGMWVEQQKLVGLPSSPTALQGLGVSLSANGKVLTSGAPQDGPSLSGSFTGATFVFRRRHKVWGQKAKLIGVNFDGSVPTDSSQGASVSVSGSGNVVAVGAFGDSGGWGAVWVFSFKKKRRGWSQDAKLVGMGGVGAVQNQGFPVSLSQDGGTIATGATANANLAGGVYVFTHKRGKNPSAWRQRGQGPIVGPDAAIDSFQGFSTALSKHGCTLAAGGFPTLYPAGGTWIYERTGNACDSL